jgi:hypothetical protein
MKTDIVLYDNELKYQSEFEENLKQCRDELRKLFGNNENGIELIAVCAPGIYKINQYAKSWNTIFNYIRKSEFDRRAH